VVLGRGRSDIVVAGTVVIRQLARRFRSTGLVCSTHGLRYGLARLAASEWSRTAASGEGGAR
jgi:exopolyphosphatase/pppGpp-phosphohydrolase